ncbi:Zinc finger homeobox protein 2 [Oryzias melastigma]|uniref:Zinc finger homeobox protein 2 n=1 Tax=Oryzias melastigma TaxID=30732 RepID=A0A834C4U1_ORYME|nr:Zinc finger homeobox protein 2 [Oryzias melastigma]
MQEESGELVRSQRNGVAKWVCPLCQQGQSNRSSLSLHLNEQHSVLPSCVNRLLDIIVLKQSASEEEENQAPQSTDTESLHTEDSSSESRQSRESSNSTQMLGDKDMDEDRAMEQEGGKVQQEQEEEETPIAGAKQQNATESTEMPDTSEKSLGKNGVPAENNTRSFKCNACQESFSSRTALSVHYTSTSHIQRMTTGPAKQGAESNPQSPSVSARPFTLNKPYQCAVCRVSYNHAITLESHMKSVLHQTRSRNAGMVAQTVNSATTAANLRGNAACASNIVVTSGNETGHLVTSSTSAAPGTLMPTSAKEGEQIPTSQVAQSLLASPVASAQAVSAFLTLLTSSPNTLSHSLLPSLFTASAAPGAAAPQLVPQPQMVMPLILNGLQAQTQQHQENQQGQLLTQCVPFVGLGAAQQALLTQRLNSLQNQWPSAGLLNIQPSQEDPKQTVQSEGEQEKKDSIETSEDQMRDDLKRGSFNIKEEKCEELYQCDSTEVKVDSNEGRRQKERRSSSSDRNAATNQLESDADKAAALNLSQAATERSLCNNVSPSTSMPSNASLSPVNLNLTLSPDSTPQKPLTSPGDSPKSNPSSNALTTNQTRLHSKPVRSSYPDLPVLSEFQSEVLWAFFESRSEADAASPPHEDCEALGREVGLSEEEVRRWLTQACQAKQRQRATEVERLDTIFRTIPRLRGL